MSIYDYEREQRRRIHQTDWSKLHVQTDRRQGIHLPSLRKVYGVVSDKRLPVGVRVSRGGFKEERRP